jgi:hypothetical protein
MTRTGRVLLWVLAVLAGLVALAVLWFAAVLSGGFDDLLSGGGPKRTDNQVVKAGERAHEQAKRELGALVEQHLRQALGPQAVTLATATTDTCETGQHNWKVDDSYDLRCSVSDAVLITGTTSALREQVLALHASLAPDWGGPSGTSLSEVVTQYWDRRASFGADRPYRPSSLPEADYRSTDETAVLHVRWADSRSRELTLSGYGQDVQWRSAAGAPLDPAAVVGLIPAGDTYALVVEVERESFED